MAYTDDELAMLSDEERQAIADDQHDPEALAAIAGEGGEDGGDTEAAASAADAGADDDASGQAEQATQPAAEADDDRSTFVPTYRADPVEGYETKIAELDAQFESGDIGLQDYNKQRDALVRSQLKAEIASEQNAQVEEQLWQREITDFMDDHKEYKESKLRHAALDAAVKDLANNPANNDKTGRWFLREAHKLVQKELGGAQAAADTPPPAKPDSSRKPDLRSIPKTLAHLPAAEITQAGEVDEFAHLDRMSGLELEQAVSRLSPAERERYRRAA